MTRHICRFALLLVVLVAVPAFATSVGYSVAPSSQYTVPSAPANSVFVTPDAGTVTVTATLSMSGFGNNVTYPMTAVLGTKPSGPGKPTDVTVSPGTCTFASRSATCTVQISFTSNPKNYVIVFGPDEASDAAGKKFALGQSLTIHHHAAAPVGCTPVATRLTVTNACVKYHQPTTDVRFTLGYIDANNTFVGLGGERITYTVQNGGEGSTWTDANGSATATIDTSALPVGDHDIVATFAGDDCFNASSATGRLGVSYNISPFLQPIPAPVNRFKGKVIPVKFRVTDYFGATVPDAAAYFTYQATVACGSETSSEIIDGEAIANTNNDSGNLFRYDAEGDLYIFNWNVGAVPGGWYVISANLGEGSCGTSHTACVQIVK